MSDAHRILIHLMSEVEQGAATAEGALTEQTSVSAAYVAGSATDSQIAALEAQGVFVERLAPNDLVLPAPHAAPAPFARSSASLATDDEVAAVRERLAAGADGRSTYAVEVAPIGVDPGSLFESVGASVEASLGGGWYRTRLDDAQRAGLDALDEIIGSDLLSVAPPRRAGRSLNRAERAALAPRSGRRRAFDILANAPDRLGEIEDWLSARAVKVLDRTPMKLRIALPDSSPLLDEIDRLDAVDTVMRPPRLRPCLDRARALIGLPAVAPPGLPGLDGAGEVIGMSDGRVDADHPDLAGRVTLLSPGLAAHSAHGTHVAGILIGDGAASGGKFKGVAPAATLIAHDVAFGEDLDTPDFGTVLEQAYKKGARVYNLSMEEALPPGFRGSRYTLLTMDIDRFVAAHPDMIVVIAGGNQGQSDRHPCQRDPGDIDLESIGSPGVAKNAICVGASCSDRTDGGHPATNWRDFDRRFKSDPAASLPLSGKPDHLAAISARGWGDSGRIKPDLVAPGTNIVAARARGDAATLWGVVDDHYLFSGGTSMAAPLVAGSCALVRRYFIRAGHAEPSAALVRAALACGARWLPGVDANHAFPRGLPPSAANFDQGFGCVDLSATLPPDGGNRRLLWLDVGAAASGGSFAGAGTISPFRASDPQDDRRRFTFDLEAGTPLNIAMCFTDPHAGPTGVCLQLQLKTPVPNERLFGNVNAAQVQQFNQRPSPDALNNVQVIRFATPVAGNYIVQVSALKLLGRDAAFSLVISGDVRNLSPI